MMIRKKNYGKENILEQLGKIENTDGRERLGGAPLCIFIQVAGLYDWESLFVIGSCLPVESG